MNHWPPDSPSEKIHEAPSRRGPVLPASGGNAQHRKKFAAQAFELFCAKVLQRIGNVNQALRNFHNNPSELNLEAYRNAVGQYHLLLRETTIDRPYDDNPAYGVPARVFAIEGLEVKISSALDYCTGFSVSGAVVFSASGPSGESSSSSSSYPVLPPPYPP